jgi:hypothetical protein
MILCAVPSESVWIVFDDVEYLIIQDLFGPVGARLK